MSFENLALKCGVESSDFQDLVYGHVRPGIEKKLGIPASSLQIFLDGDTSEELASKIGISSSDLQFLRYQNGRDGAIGLVVGVLLRNGS